MSPLYELAARNTGSVYNIRDFGAVGDGKTLDSKAIEEALSMCCTAALDLSAQFNGASELCTVLLPAPGTYLSGPVNLCSYMQLVIEEGYGNPC